LGPGPTVGGCGGCPPGFLPVLFDQDDV